MGTTDTPPAGGAPRDRLEQGASRRAWPQQAASGKGQLMRSEGAPSPPGALGRAIRPGTEGVERCGTAADDYQGHTTPKHQREDGRPERVRGSTGEPEQDFEEQSSDAADRDGKEPSPALSGLADPPHTGGPGGPARLSSQRGTPPPTGQEGAAAAREPGRQPPPRGPGAHEGAPSAPSAERMPYAATETAQGRTDTPSQESQSDSDLGATPLKDPAHDSRPDPQPDSAAVGAAVGAGAGDQAGERATGRQRLRAALWPPRLSRAQLIVALLLFTLGLGLAIQVRSTNDQSELRGARQEDLVRILDELDGRSQRLQDEKQQLEDQRAELENSSDQAEEARRQRERKANQLAVLAGTVAAEGPGITLTINDPGSNVSADMLLDTLQELRAAGAEAIQINDVRVVADTFFSDPGRSRGVEIDGQRVAQPYRFKVIGNPQDLEPALNIPGGVVQSFEKEQATVGVVRSERIVVDALRQVKKPDHARVAPE